LGGVDECRRRAVDVEGGVSEGAAAPAARECPIPAKVGLNRATGGAAEVRDEVAEVGARGINDWRPGTAGIDVGGGGAPVRLQWWTAMGSRFRPRKHVVGLAEVRWSAG
jgi:hypothetical protein